MSPETWVDRIASKQLGYQLDLEKLRQKYQSENPPVQAVDKFGKFESLFPELREVDKTRKAEVSPGMAFEPYKITLRNPFAATPPEVTTGGQPVDWSKLQPFKPPEQPLTSEKVTAPFNPPLVTEPGYQPGAIQAGLPEPRKGIGFALDIITGRKTTENPQGLTPVEYAMQFPAAEAAIVGIPTAVVVGAMAAEGIAAATGLLLYGSIMKYTSQMAQAKNIPVSKAEAEVFANQITQALSKRFSMAQNWKNIFNFASGKYVPKPEVAQKADNIAKQAVERYLPALIPKGTQTGAMAFGGLPRKLPKQPWQMTNQEYITSVITKGNPNAAPEDIKRIVSGIPQSLVETEHKGIIQQALAEGKPVPTEVLKDYPDLAKVKPTPVTPEVTRKELLAERDRLETFMREQRQKISDIQYKQFEKQLSEVNLAIARLPEVAILKAEVTPPVTEAGMPEAGLQPYQMTSIEFNRQYPTVKDLPIKEQRALLAKVNAVNEEEMGGEKGEYALDLATFQKDFADIHFDLTTGEVYPSTHEEMVRDALKYKLEIPQKVRDEYPKLVSEIEGKREKARLLAEKRKSARQAKPPAIKEAIPEVAPQVKGVVTPTTGAKEQPTIQSLAEQLKAKLEAEPVVKPPPPKSPIERRGEIETLLKEPAKNLPKGTTKIALRKELADINKSLIPQEKKLRQDIMATVRAKSLTTTQSREIFKTAGGSRYLTNLKLDQLQKVLKSIQGARPKKIGGKIVVTETTEKAIQTLKTNLIKENSLSEQAYKDIMKFLRLKTDKLESPTRFISEKEAKELIRTMNFEAEVGLLKHQTEVTKGLEDKPELAKAIKGISARADETASLTVNNGVKVSPWQDMWVYNEKLQDRTGEPFYDIYRMMLDKRLANQTKAENIFKEIMESTPDFKVIATDREALQRVNNYLASRLGEDIKVASMSEGEIALAKKIEEVLFSFRNSVRYNRFMTAYSSHEGDITLMSKDIPNAPRTDLREAVKIYESEGASKLTDYLNIKTWGVINTGYEPHIVVNPKLQLRRIKATILPKGMLKTREGITFDAGEKTILDRTHTYIHRMLNLELEPYLRKLDMTLQKASPKLREPGKTANDLSLMIDEMKGTFYISEPLARFIAKGGGYATSVVYLAPHLGFRNLFQNAAMFPDRTALVDPRNKKLSAKAQEYFDIYVDQGRQFTQQFLLQGELGTGKVANLLRRFSFMGVSESINNRWAFWAGVNKGNRALADYQKIGDIGKFINDSGMKDLTLRQQKEVLELMALGKEKEAIWLIARKINHNTNMIYDRAQGAPVTMGTSGRLLGSLLNFTRGYGQRVGQQLGKLASGHTYTERKHAAKILVGLALFGIAAGFLYQKITGKKQNPYNPLLMLTWSPGGLAVGAMIDTADVIGNIVQAITGDKDALTRIPTDLARSGDLLIPFYSVFLNVLESLTDTKFLDRLVLRKVLALLNENYKPDKEYYQKERDWIGKLQHALFGGEPAEPLKLDEAKEIIPKNIDNLGQTDQTGLDAALKQAIADEASPQRIAEIKAKDWTYDITSLRRDIGDAIRGLTNEEITELSPIVIAYSEFANQKDAYGDLSTEEQKQYLKDNPDFITNRLFWGDNNLVTIPDLKTAQDLVSLAEQYNIPLNLIPAFKLTEKERERIPSDQNLWEYYFGYYDLPSSSYLGMTQEQVDAGLFPPEYLAKWQEYQALKTDKAKSLFREKYPILAKSTWRDDFRRTNPEFDWWLQDNKDMKPLAKKTQTTQTQQPITLKNPFR